MLRKKLDKLEYVLPLCGFAAGCVDIIGFARLGGVFASAMTGNLALLALYSAAGSLASAGGALLALMGFISGACLGTLLARARPAGKAITVLLGTETILLAVAVLLWFAGSERNGRLFGDALIVSLAVAMGVQSICGKKIDLSAIPTIVFTSTLTNIVIAVTESLARRTALPADAKRQLVAFSAYFIGAFAAGLLVFFGLRVVILLPLMAAGAALLVHLE